MNSQFTPVETVNNSVNIVNNLMFGSISCDVVYA